MTERRTGHYDSYPLPDEVDLDEYEETETAGSLLLAYNASNDVFRLATEYLKSVVAQTAVESPLVYSHLGKVRAGWHAAPGGGFQSADFRFSGYDMRWHVDRRDANAMVTAVFVRNYHDTRPKPLNVVVEEEEDKVASPARVSAPPPPPSAFYPQPVNTVTYKDGKFTSVPAGTRIAMRSDEVLTGSDRLDNPCYMRIVDLLLNTHEPGYVLAARKCEACGRMIARHNE